MRKKKSNKLPPLKLTTAAERQTALAEAKETKGEAAPWMPSEEKSNVRVVTNIKFKFEASSSDDDKVETESEKQLALADEDDSSDEEVFL